MAAKKQGVGREKKRENYWKGRQVQIRAANVSPKVSTSLLWLSGKWIVNKCLTSLYRNRIDKQVGSALQFWSGQTWWFTRVPRKGMTRSCPHSHTHTHTRYNSSLTSLVYTGVTLSKQIRRHDSRQFFFGISQTFFPLPFFCYFLGRFFYLVLS